MGTIEEFERGLDVPRVSEYCASRFDLDTERAEGVCEHVVDLSRDPITFIECCAATLFGLSLLHLGDEGGSLVGSNPYLPAVASRQQRSDEQKRQAERRARRKAEE